VEHIDEWIEIEPFSFIDCSYDPIHFNIFCSRWWELVMVRLPLSHFPSHL